MWLQTSIKSSRRCDPVLIPGAGQLPQKTRYTSLNPDFPKKKEFSMKLRTFFLPLFLAVALSGCATVTKDIQVETETRPGVNLADYKTYAWLASAEIVNDPDGNWEPPGFDADAELRFLINGELRNKGMKEVFTKPDLFVGFAAGINMEVLKIVEDPETKMYNFKDSPKGALVVVLIDPATRRAVWVGSAVGDVECGRSSEEVAQRLAYAVRTMFSK